MISVKVQVHSAGLTVGSMLVNGKLVSNMVMVLTSVLKDRESQVSGRMVRK